MKKGKGKLYIGTSGYTYPHWENDVFYPTGLPKAKQLEYYAKHFDTVEMNYPFYKLPSAKSFSHWRETVSKDFIFTVKVSRFISHVKKLHQCESPWKTFLKRSINLKEKLGPFLFQFPARWKKNLKRLDNFLELLEKTDKKYRYVFEFRHPSWFSEDIYQLLKKYKNVSLCLADSPHWPFEEIITGDFVYIRMHGGKILYTSNYSDKELKTWAKKIKKWLNQELDVYVYFNNDAMGYAVENAKELLELCK